MSDKRKRLTRETCNPGQLRCWRALAWLMRGDHHIYAPVYECGLGIQTVVSGEAATTDSDLLTQMVVIAHVDAVRISIDGSGGPYRYRLMIHPRQHGVECSMSRHPTVADLIEMAQRYQQAADEEAKGGGA